MTSNPNSCDGYDYNTPLNNNNILSPPNEIVNSNNNNYRYATNCQLFYITGEYKNDSNYELIKHINPQGFFEIINCRIAEMISQTKMKINLNHTNCPEDPNCFFYILIICMSFIFLSFITGIIVGIISEFSILPPFIFFPVWIP